VAGLDWQLGQGFQPVTGQTREDALFWVYRRGPAGGAILYSDLGHRQTGVEAAHVKFANFQWGVRSVSVGFLLVLSSCDALCERLASCSNEPDRTGGLTGL
jgi:hypothetical protein